MNFNFHQLVRPIDISQLLFITYVDYIDWFPVIDFHQFGTPGKFKILSLLMHIMAGSDSGGGKC